MAAATRTPVGRHGFFDGWVGVGPCGLSGIARDRAPYHPALSTGPLSSFICRKRKAPPKRGFQQSISHRR